MPLQELKLKLVRMGGGLYSHDWSVREDTVVADSNSYLLNKQENN
jgi:hypothetical protein